MKIDVYTAKCPICDRAMMYKSTGRVFSPFGDSYRQKILMKELGIVFISSSKKDDNPICEVCAEKGKASFTCSLCGKELQSNMIKESFGDPAEYLCTECYTTVPASVWDEKVKKLEEAHRWDFE